MKAATTFRGRDVYRWPEFQALMERLGIEGGQRRRSLTIALDCDGAVEVTEKYLVPRNDNEPPPPTPSEKF